MKRFIAIFLLLALLLAGCATEDPYVPSGDGLTWEEDEIGLAPTEPEETEEQSLTLIYCPRSL